MGLKRHEVNLTQRLLKPVPGAEWLHAESELVPDSFHETTGDEVELRSLGQNESMDESAGK